ncbi:MAG: helix-turn-helix domain-containing protein [Flavobacteriales bacterium]|nr:helix-turn-helix domain-containing protein [Flavobacteriales bacterium]
MKCDLSNYPEVLTPTEVCELLHVKRNTLAIWRCGGQGPEYFKAGRTVLYTRTALAEWIERNSVKTGGSQP